MMQRKHDGRQIRLRDFDLDLEVKAEGDGYRLSGYGSVFGELDSYSEIVAKGAFRDTLKDIRQKGRKLPMLWQHRSAEPIGIWDVLREDDRGLYVEGTLLKGVQVAEEARIRAQAGAVTGLSIGYWVRESSRDEVTGIRTLKKLDLVETSLVTFPANDEARVDGVKFVLSHGGKPTIRDFEEAIRREFGFSKTAAATIASRGYGAWAGRDSGSGGGSTADPDAKAALDELRDVFAQPFKV